MRKLRFGDLVRHSSRPEVLTLWTPPAKNRALRKAVREHRIVTVQHRNVGNRRDAGEIGFRQAREGLYLVFPRPLDAPDGEMVIGINYELLEQPAAPDPARLEGGRPSLVPLGLQEKSAPRGGDRGTRARVPSQKSGGTRGRRSRQ